jgi:hypothetical protein
MGVRGLDPNQTDVLDAREQILVFPVPSYRLLRHTLLRPIAALRRPLVVAGFTLTPPLTEHLAPTGICTMCLKN